MTQPHNLFSGLRGGYVPNIAEHYDTKGAATDALKDLMERIDFEGTLKTRGSLKGGFYLFGWSDTVNDFHEYAEIEPCDGSCELEEFYE